MARNRLSVQDEEALLDEVASRRVRLSATARSITSQTGQLVSSYADAYPWMNPGVVQSLGQAGVPVDAPAARSVADIAARQAAEDGQFDKAAEEVPDAWYETLLNAAGSVLKPVVRGGLAAISVPFEELQALLSSAGTALFDETEAGELGFFSNLAENVGDVIGEIARPDELLADFWHNYTAKAARATGILSLNDALDLGSGWMPSGTAFQQKEQDKYRLQLDGQFMTPGRVWARMFTEPGTGAYQMLSGAMDFAQNLVLDPANLALAGLSKAQKAHRAFQTIGMIPGVRKTVAPPVAVNHFLTQPSGQAIVRAMTENRDPYAAWKALGQPDMGGLGLEYAERFAASADDATTFGLWEEVLSGVVQKPSPRFVKRTIRGVGRNEYGDMIGGGARTSRYDSTRIGFLGRLGRLRDTMPGKRVELDNLDDAAIQLDRWMANAHTPEKLRAEVFNEIARTKPNDQVAFLTSGTKAAKAVEDLLVREWEIPAARAREMTRLYDRISDDLKVFDLDDLGGNLDVMKPFRVNVGGTQVDLKPMPGMTAELTTGYNLPDPVAIRRATPAIKEIQWATNSGLWKSSIDSLRSIQANAWMPLNLLRNALTVRVVGENQGRIAASGYDGVFNHPVEALSWMASVDPKSRLFKTLMDAAKEGIGPVKLRPKGTQTFSGIAWEDFKAHTDGMQSGSAGFRGVPGEIVTGDYVKVAFGDPGFYRGWAIKLSHMANDPVFRRVAGGLKPGDLRSAGLKESTGNTFDDVFEWWWKGSGKEERLKLSRIEGREALATDPRVARDYLQQVYFDNLQTVTTGNPDLVNLVAKGTIGDVSARGKGSRLVNARQPEHTNTLTRLLEDAYGEAAPGWIGTPRTVSAGRKHAFGDVVDHFWEKNFDRFLSKPENFLNRSPVLHQLYFKRGEELIGFATREIQEQMIRGAKEAGMDDGYLMRLAAQVNKGAGTQIDSMRKVEVLAGSYALSEMKSLLYDLSNRKQWADVFKLIFPFGDVWKDVLGTWGRIVRQNPQTIRRFQQGLEGIRQPSLLGEAETTPGTGEGFFHTDPSTGEEVFSYPFVGKLMSSMLGLGTEGAGVEFTGRASGLNLVTATALPGIGPAITIPMSHIVPNTPSFKFVEEVLFPFGRQKSIVDAFVPAWAEQFRQAFGSTNPDKTRMFANTVADTMRALAATGKYDTSTAEGQQLLLDAATTRARILYVVRGIAQFNLPTGPSFSWATKDVDGNTVATVLLSEDLRKLTEEYGGDRNAAFQEWVKKYGVDNVLAVIGKTTSIVDRPVTEKGDAWLREHADLEEANPLTIGLFAPEDAEGEFDYTAYLRSLETGAREPLSPAEQLALANDFLGRVQFEQAKKIAALHPGPVSSMFLSQTREQIAEEYPGFDGWVSRAQWEKKPKPDEMIAELRRAVQNETLAQTDAGQGIRKYLSALDAASQMVLALPGNTRHYQSAKSAAPIRFWLRSVAAEIIQQNPDFARAYNMVFERELADDDF